MPDHPGRRDVEPHEVDRRAIPDVHRTGCTSYHAGHNVHWIQALHTANKPEVAQLSWPGTIVSIDDEILAVRTPTGEILRYRNHDLLRLAAAVDNIGAEVVINSRYAILRVGTACFSIRQDTGEPLDACPTDELIGDVTTDQLARRIDTHGGILFRPNR